MHRRRLSRRPCRFGRQVPRPPLAQHLTGTLPMPRYRFCCPLEPWAGMHRPPTGPRCATSGIWAGHLSRRRQQPFADDGRPSPTRPRSGTANGVSRQGAERSSRTCVRRSGPASPRGNRAIASGNAAQHANGQAPCRPGAGLRGRAEAAEQAARAGAPATLPTGMAERQWALAVDRRIAVSPLGVSACRPRRTTNEVPEANAPAAPGEGRRSGETFDLTIRSHILGPCDTHYHSPESCSHP